MDACVEEATEGEACQAVHWMRKTTQELRVAQRTAPDGSADEQKLTGHRKAAVVSSWCLLSMFSSCRRAHKTRAVCNAKRTLGRIARRWRGAGKTARRAFGVLAWRLGSASAMASVEPVRAGRVIIKRTQRKEGFAV